MAAEKEVKLLGFWMSHFSIRCRIALEEKEVDYDYKEENLSEKSELLLKANPVHKKIPVLLHHGKPICESLIIVQYIDEVFPGKAPLLPSDPYSRAIARFWADYVDKKIFECAFRLSNLRKGEELEETKNELIENLRTLEVELEEKKYFGGEVFGLVDIALVPFTSRFYSLESFAELSMDKECPKLAAWGKRCLERESVAKSLPGENNGNPSWRPMQDRTGRKSGRVRAERGECLSRGKKRASAEIKSSSQEDPRAAPPWQTYLRVAHHCPVH